ncbi:hypothetical protein HYPSUDRAFT_35690 [Hypholoma sublateritium FD-334 SS-4]|uniref:Uncharacterized protein n=1 Tax=Hypholoma sublateritium (strain FD-334 SS-4) TaxID=945553 RepID=A0A0D2P809_HYPSF|nr:hypothetical protein HYPSUDRAFT_35690 [Hypholoma sublateritium FD-334 SS-4]
MIDVDVVLQSRKFKGIGDNVLFRPSGGTFLPLTCPASAGVIWAPIYLMAGNLMVGLPGIEY